MAEQSIRSLYSLAEKRKDAAEIARDSGNSTYKENLTAAIATYEECRKLADRLSLFSPNETLEDIATGDLEYLLIDYRIGELLIKVSDVDRKSTLQIARTAFERYLSLLDQYSIFTTAEKKLYRSYTDHPRTFSTISVASAEARRASKIANYNYEKGLTQKLATLATKPAYYLEQDDSTIRNLHLMNLALCTHHTFQALETMNRELEILAVAPATATAPTGPQSASADPRQVNQSSTTSTAYSDRLDRIHNPGLSASNSGPILSPAGRPLQPFTLLSNRQTLAASVFQPSHNLPTMTIDEYLAEERRRGGIIDGGGDSGGGGEPIVDEDDMERADEETVKAREWDDFKESNAKGTGNTLNRG